MGIAPLLVFDRLAETRATWNQYVFESIVIHPSSGYEFTAGARYVMRG